AELRDKPGERIPDPAEPGLLVAPRGDHVDDRGEHPSRGEPAGHAGEQFADDEQGDEHPYRLEVGGHDARPAGKALREPLQQPAGDVWSTTTSPIDHTSTTTSRARI